LRQGDRRGWYGCLTGASIRVRCPSTATQEHSGHPNSQKRSHFPILLFSPTPTFTRGADSDVACEVNVGLYNWGIPRAACQTRAISIRFCPALIL
jgi:hypothetical protein